MPMRKTLLISLVFLGLVGCATQRPQMPDGRYSGFARAWAAVGYCNNKGWIDADTAARGRTYVSSAMNTHTFDHSRMAAEIVDMGKTPPPSQEDCRALAMGIQTRKQQIEVHNAAVAQEAKEIQNAINATRPTQTFCNKVGDQLLCNSY